MLSNANDDFSHRVAPHLLPELMDGECSYEEFRACLKSLAQVNRWSLGYRPTLAWLGRLPGNLREPLRIVDVGSGGGDLLRKIAAWAKRYHVAVELTGIDLNPYAARAAAESTPDWMKISWVTSDALAFRSDKPIDIFVSSLMMHHLEDQEIISMLTWIENNSQIGWFINDLERSERTSKFFARLAKLMGWHSFVAHDGPVSFRRAFLRQDWVRLLKTADIPLQSVTIRHWRPGRLCVGRLK